MLTRSPLVVGNKTYQDVTEDVLKPIETPPSKGWLFLFSKAAGLFLFYLVIIGLIIANGIGLLGVNHPIGWGTMIVTFVFWIGIGHAGTLISAILFLFRQKWRTSVARSAEAMTVFAVATAGIFPLLHTGRSWLDFWLFPYPNQRGPLWVNFRSPLLWDVFAVSTYATVSIVFWYIGLVPDFATVRDRAKNKIRRLIYGALSLGWRGTAKNWSHYEMVYLLLAGLSTPLVLSVHTIVSFDFAVSTMPGWHTTIFPPYFVAGAIFSGFAMVVTLMTLVRIGFPAFKDYITLDHMEVMNKIIMTTGLMVGYAYGSEFFIAWYSGNEYERFTFINRAFGPYAWSYWVMVVCNVLIPQVFWFKKMRRSIPVMFIVSIFVNIGMWFERFVITITSLHRDFLPANWGMYAWSFYDTAVLLGSFGMFLTLFLLYIKAVPAISIAEMKPVLYVGRSKESSHGRNQYEQGLAAIFENESDVLLAAKKVRELGHRFEAITPFPVHGMEEACQIKRSWIPYVTFGAGLIGLSVGTWFTWWTSAVNWPLNVGGKPFFSLPAFVPIMFELTILFAALFSVGALFYACGLPKIDPPIIDPDLTSHKFAIFVPKSQERYNEEQLRHLFSSLGAKEIKVTEF